MESERIVIFIAIGIIIKVTMATGLLLLLAAWLAETFLPAARSLALRRLCFKDVTPLKAFFAAQIILTSLCYASLVWWKRITLGSHVPIREYPYITPFLPFGYFHDLLAYHDRMIALHSPQFFSPDFAVRWQYPPAMALLYVPLTIYRSEHVCVAIFFTLVIFLLGATAFIFTRKLIAAGLSTTRAYALTIGTLVLSYPFWTELLLGNMEIFGFFLVAGALLCYYRNSLYWAAVLLGLAASTKIFPFVYFALFIHRRQGKPILVGLATVILSSLVGLWILCPDLTFAWHAIREGLAQNRVHYMLTLLWQETGIDHSGFGLVKRLFGSGYGVPLPSAVLTRYMVVVAAIGLLSYVLRIRFMPVLNQIAALTIASILLPPTSHDYTLIYLYIPWALLAVFAVANTGLPQRTRGLIPAMLCFAVLFSSESEVIYRRANYSGQLKCLVLTALFVIVLCFPWEPSGSSSLPQAPPSNVPV